MDKSEELLQMLNSADGYMVGVTLVKDGVLNHFLITEKFPAIDMLRSLHRIKEQVIGMLEKGMDTPNAKDTKRSDIPSAQSTKES